MILLKITLHYFSLHFMILKPKSNIDKFIASFLNYFRNITFGLRRIEKGLKNQYLVEPFESWIRMPNRSYFSISFVLVFFCLKYQKNPFCFLFLIFFCLSQANFHSVFFSFFFLYWKMVFLQEKQKAKNGAKKRRFESKEEEKLSTYFLA